MDTRLYPINATRGGTTTLIGAGAEYVSDNGVRSETFQVTMSDWVAIYGAAGTQ